MGSVYPRRKKLWIRFKGPDGWTQLSLSNGDSLCPAVAAQQSTIIKSKSNITNN